MLGYTASSGKRCAARQDGPLLSELGQLPAFPPRSVAVRFTPVSGIDSRSQGFPSRAKSGH